jgi:hypothetical protein
MRNIFDRLIGAGCLALTMLLVTCGPTMAAILLPPVTITAAISTPVVGSVFNVPPGGLRSITLEGKFAWGSGGTTVDAYVQTSLDGGATWIDIHNFHFTTSSLNNVVNLSSGTAVTTAVTPSDGNMSSNTSQDGIIGSLLRVKYKSSGTYAGGTNLSVYVGSAAVQ